MKLSVIIPSYNSDRLLLMGLELLVKQQMNERDSYEIIVVDDGSDDNTRAYVEQLQGQFAQLHYVFRPRDSASCRSRARNLGIQTSTGDVLCFFDSGILVPLDGLARIAAFYRNRSMGRQVLMHYTYGLKVDPAETDISIVDGLSYEAADSYVPVLTGEEWQDFRHDLFCRDVSVVASPWYYGFTCAMTVPAMLVEEVGGFDEAYLGWGVEDIDFSYRLYRHGASFHHPKGLVVFHYPHPIHHSEEKRHNEIRNKAYMHAKFDELESELYLFYEGPYYTFVMEKLRALQMTDVLPAPYSERSLAELARTHLPGAKRSLLIGPDCLRTAELLGTTHLFAHSRPLVEMYQQQLPDCHVAYLLGCRTSYENQYFDVVIVTDLFRLFSVELQEHWLKELSRIAKQVVLLVSERFNDHLNVVLNSGTGEEYAVVPNPFQRKLFMERVYQTTETELRQRIAAWPRVSVWVMPNSHFMEKEGVAHYE
ncbi:glycosyltransferase involved in cell wall biosynthesis [Paenibacillus cellulosilyticus]|uniref:Glycosyltransferase involved in cell wall biosynthesis n=1 Tax=Paenibacillus cellulosilyticus TaxID=375489 RepID=A0A2V2Z1P3_9BACL|nr:glycosyltransferase family 2 protein [Paenibacillus cellulosilyticus]PWW06539.1 glycosyltransferase involved in cell wall biosynthesis [Paenibacillus cellulosilyticus]QKS46125.1 glycosyltransferase [Paenibacillus cellulosilyticus]